MTVPNVRCPSFNCLNIRQSKNSMKLKMTVEVAERSRHAARLGQFGCEEPCGTTVSRLDGALCGVNLTVNHLKVWQSPIAE